MQKLVPYLIGLSIALLMTGCGGGGASATTSDTLAFGNTFFSDDSAVPVYPSKLSQNFPLTIYSIGYNTPSVESCTSALSLVKNSGSNFFGPFYGPQPTAAHPCMKAAGNLGLQFIYQLTVKGANPDNIVYFVEGTGQNLPVSLADVRSQTTALVNRVLDDAALNKIVGAWYILPEEVRPWRKNEMDYLQVVHDAVKAAEAARGAIPRPLISYQPNNRTADQFATFANLYDVILRGTYTDGYNDPSRANIISSGTSELYGGSAFGAGYTPVATFNVDRDPAAGTTDQEIFSTLRNDFYIAIAKGTKGLAIWSWATRNTPLKLTVPWRDKFISTYSTLVSELNVLEPDLGKAIVQGQMARSDAIHPKVVTGSAQALMSQDYYFEGIRYVIALNTSSSELLQISMSGWPAESVVKELLANQSGPRSAPALVTSKTVTYSLQPMQVRIWKITRNQ